MNSRRLMSEQESAPQQFSLVRTSFVWELPDRRSLFFILEFAL
jgi:hypothetical protein